MKIGIITLWSFVLNIMPKHCFFAIAVLLFALSLTALIKLKKTKLKIASIVIMLLSAGAFAFAAVSMKTFDVPVIIIDSLDGQCVVSSKNYKECRVSVLNSRDCLFRKQAEVKVRGNSTAFFGDENMALTYQVPYRIKFSEKENMLGLNDGEKFKSWVLLKGSQAALLGFSLAEKIVGEDGYYCSDCSTPAEVYLNGEFRGIYVVCEQNEVDAGRVNVSEYEENYEGTDIGYFMEIDNYAEKEDYYFTTDFHNRILTDINGRQSKAKDYDYTFKNEIYSTRQVDFAKKYLDNIFTVIYNAVYRKTFYTLNQNCDIVAFKDCSSEFEAVNNVIDVRSFVDMYILYELDGNATMGDGSFYMAIDFSKDSTIKRLTFLCPWDFDECFDISTEGYYAMTSYSKTGDDYIFQNPWFSVFAKSDWLMDMVKERWQELRKDNSLDKIIKGYEKTLASMPVAISHYDEKWPDLVPECKYDYTPKEYIEYCNSRIIWLDSQWLSNKI